MVTGARGAGQPLAEGEDAHFVCAKIMTACFSTDDILVKAPPSSGTRTGGFLMTLPPVLQFVPLPVIAARSADWSNLVTRCLFHP